MSSGVTPLYIRIKVTAYNKKKRFIKLNKLLYINIYTPPSYVSFEDKP